MTKNILRLLTCSALLSVLGLGTSLKADDTSSSDTAKPHHHHHHHCHHKQDAANSGQ
jgi:hypothetical protein